MRRLNGSADRMWKPAASKTTPSMTRAMSPVAAWISWRMASDGPRCRPSIMRIAQRGLLAACVFLAVGGGAEADDTLRAGEALYPDETVSSADGRFHLRYQSDGNLVLYREDWDSAVGE